MKKSQYFEAGITVYPSVARMKLTETHLFNTNQKVSAACFVEDEQKYYHLQDGMFVEIKVVAQK